jgi:hypothetical protein
MNSQQLKIGTIALTLAIIFSAIITTQAATVKNIPYSSPISIYMPQYGVTTVVWVGTQELILDNGTITNSYYLDYLHLSTSDPYTQCELTINNKQQTQITNCYDYVKNMKLDNFQTGGLIDCAIICIMNPTYEINTYSISDHQTSFTMAQLADVLAKKDIEQTTKYANGIAMFNATTAHRPIIIISEYETPLTKEHEKPTPPTNIVQLTEINWNNGNNVQINSLNINGTTMKHNKDYVLPNEFNLISPGKNCYTIFEQTSVANVKTYTIGIYLNNEKYVGTIAVTGIGGKTTTTATIEQT